MISQETEKLLATYRSRKIADYIIPIYFLVNGVGIATMLILKPLFIYWMGEGIVTILLYGFIGFFAALFTYIAIDKIIEKCFLRKYPELHQD